jgi:hypothetical protein
MNFLGKMFLEIPFVRVVFKSPLKTHKEAAKQLFLICLASFFPILISALIDTIQPTVESTRNGSWLLNYLHNFNGNLKFGELYIYVVTFCAPIAWVAMKFNDAGRPIEDMYWGGIFVAVIYSLALVFYVMARYPGFSPSSHLLIVGYLLIVAIICLTYISMLYESRLSIVDYEEASHQSSISLAERLAKLRK